MHRADMHNSIRTPRLRLAFALGIVLGAAAALSACSSQIDRHGHQFSETEIKQIIPGMTKDAVKAQAGTPDTTSTMGVANEVYYYISSTKKTVAFMKPEEIDRKVLAVYFTPHGAVEKVAHYGLKDGRVINLISRETPSHAAEQTLLKQLFRNLGYKQVFGE
jgi:outer membrane protein assembly factor BamE (lipoprotein component of BamABCDE complex)